jgi:hypothetical protein
MTDWLIKTTEIGRKYKEVSALLLKHKQGKVHLSPTTIKSLKYRRSQFGLFLRMLKSSAEHHPLMSFYEERRFIAIAKYDDKKKAKIAATKDTIGKFKQLSSSQVRAIIKAYR